MAFIYTIHCSSFNCGIRIIKHVLQFLLKNYYSEIGINDEFNKYSTIAPLHCTSILLYSNCHACNSL